MATDTGKQGISPFWIIVGISLVISLFVMFFYRDVRLFML